MIRIGLTQLISDEPDFEVCGECTDAREVFPLIDSRQPDLIVVDISLENSNGLTLIHDIKKTYKSLKMLVYSMHDELLFAPRAIHAGAMGYVNKHSHPKEVIDAIRKILRGRLAVSDRVSEGLLAHLASTGMEPAGNSMASLSNRELEIFELLGRGATIREIAERLGRSVKTMETHRERIMAKLGLDSSAKLVRQAVEWVTEQDRIQRNSVT
ncbi:MAG: response regulator transcription factor [Candidatus Hydrogenedentes bacterium]|nr:response regulator transcription factor [Candidatus Hydrogenedentota bacterium]